MRVHVCTPQMSSAAFQLQFMALSIDTIDGRGPGEKCITSYQQRKVRQCYSILYYNRRVILLAGCTLLTN